MKTSLVAIIQAAKEQRSAQKSRRSYESKGLYRKDGCHEQKWEVEGKKGHMANIALFVQARPASVAEAGAFADADADDEARAIVLSFADTSGRWSSSIESFTMRQAAGGQSCRKFFVPTSGRCPCDRAAEAGLEKKRLTAAAAA